METAEHQDRSGKVGGLLLGAILAVAAGLRLLNLDRTSLWYDEAVSWNQSRHSLQDLLTAVAGDNYPPLHNLILWLTMPVIGDSETALRLPSALLGLAAVWLIYLAGKELAGRNAGLLAATLLALSPFHIWYSTEARNYALLAACGLVFLLFLFKVLERPTHTRFAGLAIGGTLFLYSHTYALLGFAGTGAICGLIALSEIWTGKSLRRSNAFAACLAMGISALLFLPWLSILADRAHSVANNGFWIAYPDLLFLETMVFTITGSLALFWVLCALALTGVAALCVRPNKATTGQVETQRTWQKGLVCLGFTVGPPLLAYLYSITVQPILFDRYLIGAWPGLLLLAAAGAVSYLPHLALIAVAAGALWLSFPELAYTVTQKLRPEWRKIATYYLQNRSPADRLLLHKRFAAPALTYYLRDTASFEPLIDFDNIKVVQERPDGDRFWLLLVHSDDRELVFAERIFEISSTNPALKVFGFGASGLTLMPPPDKPARKASGSQDEPGS